MAFYLGLDSSTQSVSAVVLEIAGDRRRIVYTDSFQFDAVLPRYGTRHGVLPNPDPRIAHSSPLMWADALDMMLARLAKEVDVRQIAAVCGSAQQHGSVYLNRHANVIGALDPTRPLVDQLHGIFSRVESPIWMDSSTSAECAEIAAAVGGDATLARRTGSRAFERFTGPQIRRFFKQSPQAYEATDRIHLVSSYLASLLAGRHAPIDTGDGSGMNLMDLAAGDWWTEAVAATAPALSSKLPPVSASWTVVGTLAPYWQRRYGYPPARVIAWSGDNPCSLIGTGLIREGVIAVSMGTSDTVFGLMDQPRVDESGTGHVFGSPTGAFMGLTVFQNGSLARERIRESLGMSWTDFSRALEETAPTSGGILLPWFEPEITPRVSVPGARRFFTTDEPRTTARALIESQQMAMSLHSSWMGVRVHTIHATGGASANRAILQIMADVFGAKVYQLAVTNSAALGAALRAVHADATADGHNVSWPDVVRLFAEPVGSSVITPDPLHHAMYEDWKRVYRVCEAQALGRGPDPEDGINR
jgi:xylulokinase